jgi:hypothetical protein
VFCPYDASPKSTGYNSRFSPGDIRQGLSPTAPRDLIRARTVEGRERAKPRGVALGRKPKLKLTPHQRRETLSDIAGSYNVSHSTIFPFVPLCPAPFRIVYAVNLPYGNYPFWSENTQVNQWRPVGDSIFCPY